MSAGYDPARNLTFASDTYKLPNDTPEHARLERQAHGLRTLMGGRNYHARLTKPLRICDVGCGTGAVTVALAAEYPDAEVVGIDLSEVPMIHTTPPNVNYVCGDVRELAGKHERLPLESFDLVFSRLLVFGIQDWPAYVRLLASLARPGGSVEIQELSLRPFENGKPVPDGYIRVFEELKDAYREMGMDLQIGENVSTHMREAGLQAIEVKDFKWTNGAWDKAHPETLPLGQASADLSAGMQRMLVTRSLKDRYTQHELDELVEESVIKLGPKEGRYAKYYVNVAMKSH